MCGIFAQFGFQRPFCHQALRILRKRGPDAIGFWTDGTMQMGHTRLAIIGLDDDSAQPMENDTHVLIFNGEIYNFDEIRARLAAEDVHVRGVSDSEVLLYAWSRWGISILRDLTGFWAFAAYDKRARKLTLVRDQFGIKPLYYWRSTQGVCAASMLGAILDVVEEPAELDTAAMSEYVRYQFTFGDKTFIRQVKKVLPGHAVEFDLNTGQMTSACYEDILAADRQGGVPLTEEWIAETRELLRQSVIDSTISDTSFTTFCSGGIDSSLITRLASPEIAYHANYADPECNETFYAQQVTEDTSTRLFVVNAQEDFDLVHKLRDIVLDFDELVIGSVILPLDDLLAQVKRRYKVILTGTGGDELFAGYVRYQLALGECHQASYRGLFEKMRPLASVADRFELAHRKGIPTLYRFYQPEVEQTFKTEFNACYTDNDHLRAMLRFDRRYFLQGLLSIDDKMCGRHSLEGRPSLLHQKFARHVMQLDPAALIQGTELKSVLKRIATGILPDGVIHRGDKMGFTTPIGVFVNQSAHRVREHLAESPFRDLYELRGMPLTAENKFSREVFGLLMLDLWLNRYARRQRAPQPELAAA
jgi:asparagine synthase (glutamine-hydrolysing)